MGNIVEVQVSDEKITLKIPHKNIVSEIDNVASFDSRTKKLVSTGIGQKEFEEKYPKKWNKYKNHLEFHSVFDAALFNPEAAGMFLWEWWNEMTRQGVAGNIVFRTQAKLEIKISFDYYEDIPLDKQQDFEHLVFRYLYAKRLIINGNEKQWDRRNKTPIWLFSILNYIFVIGFILLAIIPASILTTLISMAELPSLLEFLLFTIILFGGLYVFMILGDFVSKLLWILFMKPFFANRILIRVLEYQINLPQKHKSSKSTSFLVNWLLAGNK